MYDSSAPKKSLGQHWLTDIDTLERICDDAELKASDVVVEIGPGQGTLTELLVQKAKQVIAVELDTSLISSLKQII
jgi:16S rRNA (adenine1518-N6/adenine1519-N6)-dimethyltransferase